MLGGRRGGEIRGGILQCRDPGSQKVALKSWKWSLELSRAAEIQLGGGGGRKRQWREQRRGDCTPHILGCWVSPRRCCVPLPSITGRHWGDQRGVKRRQQVQCRRLCSPLIGCLPFSSDSRPRRPCRPTRAVTLTWTGMRSSLTGSSLPAQGVREQQPEVWRAAGGALLGWCPPLSPSVPTSGDAASLHRDPAGTGGASSAASLVHFPAVGAGDTLSLPRLDLSGHFVPGIPLISSTE